MRNDPFDDLSFEDQQRLGQSLLQTWREPIEELDAAIDAGLERHITDLMVENRIDEHRGYTLKLRVRARIRPDKKPEAAGWIAQHHPGKKIEAIVKTRLRKGLPDAPPDLFAIEQSYVARKKNLDTNAGA